MFNFLFHVISGKVHSKTQRHCCEIFRANDSIAVWVAYRSLIRPLNSRTTERRDWTRWSACVSFSGTYPMQENLKAQSAVFA